MNFSEALELIKHGKKLTRTNWNGKGLFVYLVPDSEFEVNREPLKAMFQMGTKIKYRPHIDLKTADDTCGVWSISNSDVLANDWEILE